MGTEPILEIRKTNGGHHCDQFVVIQALSDRVQTQESTVKEMSSFQSDLGSRFMLLERRIGGPDPINPLVNTGLIGAVQHLTSNVAELVQEVKNSRSSIHAIEEKEEVTGIQSRDALIMRLHASEAREAKLADDARAEAKSRAAFQRAFILKALGIVGTAITSGVGLAWLAKVFL